MPGNGPSPAGAMNAPGNVLPWLSYVVSQSAKVLRAASKRGTSGGVGSVTGPPSRLVEPSRFLDRTLHHPHRGEQGLHGVHSGVGSSLGGATSCCRLTTACSRRPR